MTSKEGYVKVRKFMPLIVAVLVAVVTLALGAAAGSAKTDVKAAPAARDRPLS